MTRLGDLQGRLNYCPLGSGAVAGATLKLDRTIAARELEFAAPTANSMDATSDRDFALEYLQALTLIAFHASRFAEEITLYATAEFGFVELPEAFSTGSSAMPQKKNPDLTELVRAKVAASTARRRRSRCCSRVFRWPITKTCRRARSRSFPRLTRGANDRAAGPVYAPLFASTRLACAVPARPVISMQWRLRPTSCTRGSLSQGARENWPGRALWFGEGLRTRRPHARRAEGVWAGVRSRFFFEHHARRNRKLPRCDRRHRGGPGA